MRCIGDIVQLRPQTEFSKRSVNCTGVPAAWTVHSGAKSLSLWIQLRNSESVRLKAPASVSSTAVWALEDIASVLDDLAPLLLLAKACTASLGACTARTWQHIAFEATCKVCIISLTSTGEIVVTSAEVYTELAGSNSQRHARHALHEICSLTSSICPCLCNAVHACRSFRLIASWPFRFLTRLCPAWHDTLWGVSLLSGPLLEGLTRIWECALLFTRPDPVRAPYQISGCAEMPLIARAMTGPSSMASFETAGEREPFKRSYNNVRSLALLWKQGKPCQAVCLLRP